MGVEKRGFGSMDRARLRDVTSSGGKAAHAKGVAHTWTSEEASAAGRKSAQNRRLKRDQKAGLAIGGQS